MNDASVILTAGGHNTLPADGEWIMYKNDNWEFTCADIVCMKLPEKWFAVAGMVKTNKKDLTKHLSGQVSIYGVDQDRICISTGVLDETESAKTKTVGLMAYKISTKPGYSGSPLISIKGRKLKISFKKRKYVCVYIYIYT